jgi:hypothetical protein
MLKKKRMQMYICLFRITTPLHTGGVPAVRLKYTYAKVTFNIMNVFYYFRVLKKKMFNSKKNFLTILP